MIRGRVKRDQEERLNQRHQNPALHYVVNKVLDQGVGPE